MPAAGSRGARGVFPVFLTLASVVSGVGCHSDDVDPRRREFASKYCALYDGCCASAGLRSDGAHCRSNFEEFRPGPTFNPEAADACLTALETASTSPAFCDGEHDPAVCRDAFAKRGTGAPGATCKYDEDCALSSEGSVVCVHVFFGAGSEVDLCQLRKVGTAGSTPCLATINGDLAYNSVLKDVVFPTGYTCEFGDGLHCQRDLQTCRALEPIGNTCVFDEDCVPEAYCAINFVCAMRKPVGADCLEADECTADAFCAGSCMTRLPGGSACGTDDECVSKACFQGTCGTGTGNFGLLGICGT